VGGSGNHHHYAQFDEQADSLAGPAPGLVDEENRYGEEGRALIEMLPPPLSQLGNWCVPTFCSFFFDMTVG